MPRLQELTAVLAPAHAEYSRTWAPGLTPAQARILPPSRALEAES